MPDLSDRNRLVVVRPKEAPEGVKPEDLPEHIVGAAWLEAFPEDFEFLRYDGETQEQATAREAAEAEAAKPAKTPAPPRGDQF